MAIFNHPPHKVNIFLPAAPTFDTGGGTKLNWPEVPSQRNCPCLINTQGSRVVSRQGQGTITVGNRIAFLSSAIQLTLVQGAKFVTVDTNRTFIVQGMEYPNRSTVGHDSVSGIPALTYVTCDEIL